jgi:repressor LexA
MLGTHVRIIAHGETRVNDLSDKQQRILDFLRDYTAEHPYPPSIREICSACSISSTSVADYNLRALESKGYIRRNADISRGLEVVGAQRRASLVRVPVIGQIAAGQPIPVPDDRDWSEDAGNDSVDVGAEVARGRKLFALRVKGQSMIDALINDGDVVVLEPADSADDGAMVAAWVRSDNEATLKRIYHEGNQVRLQPANTTMAPIMRPASDVEVQGKVVAVLRTL